MLMKFNEIYYDWNDGLSTDWLGWEREKNDIYRFGIMKQKTKKSRKLHIV